MTAASLCPTSVGLSTANIRPSQAPKPGECSHSSHRALLAAGRAEHPPKREDEEKLSSPCTDPFPGQVELIAVGGVHRLRIVTTRSVWGKKKKIPDWVSNLCLAARRELGMSRGTPGPGLCCFSAASTSDNVICLHLPSILHLHCCEELTDCSQRERFVLLCFGGFFGFFFPIQTIQF